MAAVAAVVDRGLENGAESCYYIPQISDGVEKLCRKLKLNQESAVLPPQ